MKRLIATVIGSLLTTGVAAAQGADFSSIVLRPDVFPDEYKIPSDGTDDSPSIQRAINQLCRKPGRAGSGGIVRLKQHVYEIDSSITVPCSISMSGTGWEEQMTLGGGSWLHITSKLGVFAPAFNVTTTYARSSQFSNFAITEDMPLPSTVSGSAWTPTPYREVFNLNGVGAAVFFKHILWDGVYRGVAADGAGRIEMDGMYADVFSYLIRLDGSLDVDRIRNVHVWPYWTNSTVSGSAVVPSMNSVQQANVSVWKRTNTDAIVLGRADSPFLDDIFGIDLHSTVRFTNTTSGNLGYATKVKIGKLTCDQSQYCLYVDPGATAASAIIDQLDWQGEDGTNLGHPNTGGAAVKIEGAALLQIGAVHAEFIGEGIFSVVNPSICSQINVGTVWGNFRGSGPTTPVAYLPSCGSGHHTMKVGAYDGIPYPGSTTTYVNGTGTFNLPTLNPNGSGGSNSGSSIPANADLSYARTLSAGAMSLRTNSERNGTTLQPQDYLGTGGTPADLIAGRIDAGKVINAMISGGVRAIHIPCGVYQFTTGIRLINNVTISGDGACVILSDQILSGDLIAGSSVQYTQVHDLTIQADVAKTSGSSIYYKNSFENRVHDVLFTNGSGKHWTNITLDGANSTHIDRVTGRGGSHDGLAITGTDKRSEDTYFSSSGFNGYGGAALHVTWSSGLYLNSLDLLGSTQGGVVIDPDGSKGQEVDGLRGTSVLSDSNLGPGWSLIGSGLITEFNLTNSWGSTNGYRPGSLDMVGQPVAGFLVLNPNANNVTVASSEFHMNSGTGVDIQAGTHVVINGNTVFMNSTGKPGAFPGINIGQTPNYVTVTGNQTGLGGEAQSNLTKSVQSYGIISAQPVSDGSHYAVFLGNIATGNMQGGFNIPTSAAAPNVVSG